MIEGPLEDVAGEVINVATGVDISVTEVADLVLDVLGKPASQVPDHYEQGEFLVDTATDLETNATKLQARQNSLLLRRGALLGSFTVILINRPWIALQPVDDQVKNLAQAFRQLIVAVAMIETGKEAVDGMQTVATILLDLIVKRPRLAFAMRERVTPQSARSFIGLKSAINHLRKIDRFAVSVRPSGLRGRHRSQPAGVRRQPVCIRIGSTPKLDHAGRV